MERIVFSNTFEGMLRHGPGRKLDDAGRAELKAIGVDLEKDFLPGYPEQVWLDTIELLARRTLPELSREAAYARLGEECVYGVGETFIGKAMLMGAQLLGPRRVLLRLTRSLRSSSNCVQSEAVELGPECVQLDVTDYSGPPQLMEGSLLGVTRMAGGKDVRVTVLGNESTAGHFKFQVAWAA